MRKTVRRTEIGRGLAVVVGSVLLVCLSLTALLRGYDVIRSQSVPRSGIGETRWFQMATGPGPGTIELLRGLPESALKRVTFPGDFDAIERAWFLNLMRYACPGSDVQVAASGKAMDPPLTVVIQPACLPELPEFLAVEKGVASHELLGVLSWIVALFAFAWIGRRLLGPPRLTVAADGWPVAPRIGVEVSVGWALASLISGLAVALGIPPVYGLLGAGVAAACLLSIERRQGPPLVSCLRKQERSPTRRWSGLSVGLALVSLTLGVLATVRAWRQPLWSWDHHVIWGFKARQLATGVSHFLTQDGYDGPHPDYPLGVPLAWILGGLGRLPRPWDFHLAWSVSMVLSIVLLARLLRSLPKTWMWCALAFAVASPLYWDLEGVGLAELPLAGWCLAALVCAGSNRRRAWLGTAICLAMIAFTKNEGAVLAVVLGPAVGVQLAGGAGAGKQAAIKALVCGAFGVVAVRLATAFQTEANTSFFRGEVLDRLQQRLLEPGTVFAPVLDQLDHPSWMGLWLLVPVGCVLLSFVAFQRLFLKAGNRASQDWLRRCGPIEAGVALFFGAMAALGMYVMVYFATPEDVTMHIWSSWHRIISPILLWILVAVCWLTTGLFQEAEPAIEGRPTNLPQNDHCPS